MEDKQYHVDDLWEAAGRGDLDQVRQLIETGLATQEDKNHVLDNSVCNLRWRVSKYLMEQGAELPPEQYSFDYLITAVEVANINIVRKLIDTGLYDNSHKTSALNHVNTHDQFELAKYLLSQGADIQNNNGRALLHSLNAGNVPMATFLIDNGADIHLIKDKAFIAAAQRSDYTVLRYLLDIGIEDPTRDIKHVPEDVKDWIAKYINSNSMNTKLQNSLAEKPDKPISNDGKI